MITAVSLAAGVLTPLFSLPKAGCLFLVLLITGLALYEWRKLFSFHQSTLHVCSPFLYLAFCAFLYSVPEVHSELLTLVVLLWSVLIIFVTLYPRGQEIYNRRTLLAFLVSGPVVHSELLQLFVLLWVVRFIFCQPLSAWPGDIQ